MKLNSYYLHAIDCQNGNPFDGNHSIEVLKEILDSGELKSKRLRGITDTSFGGWNGIDYISLCDYRRRNNRPYGNNQFLRGYTAYNAYIKTSLSFILTKNKISAIKPQLVEPIIFDWDSHYIMYELGNSTNGRYSDLPDEVQVKDRIPFDRIKGMTIPIEYMVTEHIPEIKFKNYKYIPSYNSRELIEYLNRLKELLNQYKLSSDLYDLETQLLLDSDDTITELVNDVLARKKELK